MEAVHGLDHVVWMTVAQMLDSDMSPDRGFSNEDPWAASVGLASGPAQEASAWKSGPTSWCAQSASQGGPWEGDLVYRGLGHGAVLE